MSELPLYRANIAAKRTAAAAEWEGGKPADRNAEGFEVLLLHRRLCFRD